MKKFILGIIAFVVFALIAGVVKVRNQNVSVPDSEGLLTKQDSIDIEREWGRKIIGDIDTTLLTHNERVNLQIYLKRERDFVRRNMDQAFGYNLSDSFCVVHFFYDEKISCPFDCPDLLIWFADAEVEKLRKHINTCNKCDSIITENGDTIIRTICKRPGLHASLKRKCLGSCEGSSTTLYFHHGMKYLTIHNHHHYFCQSHVTPGTYETKWIMLNERKKNRK